jgi:ribosomal-protein-alanine N-acetyltransferase|tara:strand:+ start:1748 stop:2287 length:540 start_codon:yes stop_codon:yes gene_type:complete
MENDRVIVETHRLFIRVWKEQDQSLLHTIMSDADVMRYVWDYKPPTIGQIQDFVGKCIREADEQGWTTWALILKENLSLIGYCGFLTRNYGEYEGETEIGWLVAKEHWGKGIATEAAKAVLDFGFSAWKFDRVIASARSENTQSVKVMIKIGMSLLENSPNPKGRLVPHTVIENNQLVT